MHQPTEQDSTPATTFCSDGSVPMTTAEPIHFAGKRPRADPLVLALGAHVGQCLLSPNNPTNTSHSPELRSPAIRGVLGGSSCVASNTASASMAEGAL